MPAPSWGPSATREAETCRCQASSRKRCSCCDGARRSHHSFHPRESLCHPHTRNNGSDGCEATLALGFWACSTPSDDGQRQVSPGHPMQQQPPFGRRWNPPAPSPLRVRKSHHLGGKALHPGQGSLGWCASALSNRARTGRWNREMESGTRSSRPDRRAAGRVCEFSGLP